MASTRRFVIFFGLLWLLAGCSVISPRVRGAALPEIHLATLSGEVERFTGATVVLGGYLLDTQNQPDVTLITVLQSPLRFGDEPGVRDASQGRFVVRVAGFLDPAVYARDRKVTVAGRVAGTMTVPVEGTDRPLLLIDSEELHLWPVPPPIIYSPCIACDPYDDYFYRPLWHRRHYQYDRHRFYDYGPRYRPRYKR